MVRTGLEELLTEPDRWLEGKRVGLIAHPASVLPDLTGAAEALLKAGVRLTTLFAAEHGLAGTADDAVPDGTDPSSGLPIYSLYGATYQPTAEMLAEVDLLLFDMQDVGVRFYTYISTLFYALKGAAQAAKPLLVLDRPNPIGGTILEGPLLQTGFESFVGIAALPIRHALTLGEAALLLNQAYRLGASLQVVRMQGWQRDMWFDETGLPWVPPSPAIPHLSTTNLYPGMCLLEGTNLSEGRGTYQPFDVCGAPWIDGEALSRRLNALELEGVRFRPTIFQPRNSKFANETCSGVQLHVTDRLVFRPVTAILDTLSIIHALYPEKLAWNAHFDRLAGNDQVREGIIENRSVEEITATWHEDETQFERLRAKYLLY